MSLFFFGTADRQLFGAYHPPRQGIARGAAVLCPPWGPEYISSHRVLRRLAVRLSESGYHVLRFDYYGTGDSAGDRDEGDLGSWLADASAAVDELRDMSGMTSVIAIGLRLGAVVAWELGSSRDDVSTVVLWDPIVDGQSYVRELIIAQRELDRWMLTPRPRRARLDSPADHPIDLLGFPLTPAMRRSIERVTVDAYRRQARFRVLTFHSDAHPERDALEAALATSGAAYAVETIPGPSPWREDETMGGGSLPLVLLERMVGAL